MQIKLRLQPEYSYSLSDFLCDLLGLEVCGEPEEMSHWLQIQVDTHNLAAFLGLWWAHPVKEGQISIICLKEELKTAESLPPLENGEVLFVLRFIR